MKISIIICRFHLHIETWLFYMNFNCNEGSVLFLMWQTLGCTMQIPLPERTHCSSLSVVGSQPPAARVYLFLLSIWGHICRVAPDQWLRQEHVLPAAYSQWLNKAGIQGPPISNLSGIPPMGQLCSWAPVGLPGALPGWHGRLTALPARSFFL